MLHDGLARHRELRGDLPRRRGRPAEPLDDAAAGRVGERGEDAVRRRARASGPRIDARSTSDARVEARLARRAAACPPAIRSSSSSTIDGASSPSTGTHQNESRFGASASSTTPTRSPSGPVACNRPPGSRCELDLVAQQLGQRAPTPRPGAAGSSISRSTIGTSLCATHGLHNTTVACATMCNHAVANTSPPDRPDDGLFRRMLEQRRVMLTGPIDGALAERICAQLLVLEADDPDVADHAVPALARAARSTPGSRSTTRCRRSGATSRPSASGFAASMAQFLLCAGAPGQRSAHAHSRILMHQPLGARSRATRSTSRSRPSSSRSCAASWPSSPRSTPARPSSGSSPTATATAGSPPTEALDYGMIDDG